MRRWRAAFGSTIFFVLAPGVVAGILPWWVTRWESRPSPVLALPLRLSGVLLVGAGLGALVGAFAQFVREGRGTPAPIAPTDRLVVGGLYRYVRNPMYVAVLSIIAGQVLAFWNFKLLLYGAAATTAMVTFVRLYEEPVLRRRYGLQYDIYRRHVPGWWPRLRAWSADGS